MPLQALIMIKALIFDLDGTLVDSELIGAEALASLLPELGLSGADIVERYRGWRFATILEELAPKTRQILDDGFVQAYRQRAAARFEVELKAFPGVEEMLKTATLPMCIASSGPPEKIHRSLRVTGLGRFFGDRAYSAYDINSWKPDPDLFLHAAAALGFQPEECLVIEDSDVGLEAARRAGMRALYHTPEDTPVNGYHHFTDYADFHAAVRAISQTA